MMGATCGQCVYLLGLVVDQPQQVGISQSSYGSVAVSQQGYVLHCSGVLPGPHCLTSIWAACLAWPQPRACSQQRIWYVLDIPAGVSRAAAPCPMQISWF